MPEFTREETGCNTPLTELRDGVMIHLKDGRMLSVQRCFPRGSINKKQKMPVEKLQEALTAALELFSDPNANMFIAGRIVPDFSSLDDRTRQVPFVGVVAWENKLTLFYQPRQVFETPAIKSLGSLSGKKPGRPAAEAWLTEPAAATA